MTNIQNSHIIFGLVSIPVELHPAARENDIHFNLLVRETMERVRYKKIDPSTGEEVENEDIVRGYEYEKGKYVVVEEDDIDAVTTPADRQIHILSFAELGEVPPEYFGRAYWLAAKEAGASGYELLRRAMLEEGKIAVGKTVIRNQESLLVLIPAEAGILMQTLRYHDEVQPLTGEASTGEVDPYDLTLAKMLVGAMNRKFDVSDYKNEYQERLRAMIEQKIKGQAIRKPKPEEPWEAIPLQDALKASIQKLTG